MQQQQHQQQQSFAPAMMQSNSCRPSGLSNSITADQLRSPPLLRPQPRFSQTNMVSPTRIPSPIETNGRTRTLRYVTAPAVMPGDKEKPPQRQTRLMGPISPSHNQPGPTMSKSRTMGVLSSITSSFSRNNLRLSSRNGNRQSSSSFGRGDMSKNISLRPTAQPITALSNVTGSGTTTRSRNSSISFLLSEDDKVKLVHEPQPSAYWCGRLASLHNQYSNNMIQTTLRDQNHPKKCTALSPDSFDSPPRPTKYKDKKEPSKSIDDLLLDDSSLVTPMVLEEDSDTRYRRAFTTLQTYCTTNAAKKSLWDFQQSYARNQNNSRMLPVGGHMTDAWYTRLTHKRDRKSSEGKATSLGFGRRTGFSRFGRSRHDLSQR
ncbi:hypothetical protein BJ875DRAFT_109562 [Amylocarpus encephaloides]|uniref:Uncharacterized protein n=1 Tax=Amylocarpus encephaloides TaxID=45428 RepID=A0A9P7YEH2_9HELO|nr:hypothetical protein BJ875DRAFT_109562 [Amylocarpus encephaloides]